MIGYVRSHYVAKFVKKMYDTEKWIFIYEFV